MTIRTLCVSDHLYDGLSFDELHSDFGREELFRRYIYTHWAEVQGRSVLPVIMVRDWRNPNHSHYVDRYGTDFSAYALVHRALRIGSGKLQKLLCSPETDSLVSELDRRAFNEYADTLPYQLCDLTYRWEDGFNDTPITELYSVLGVFSDVYSMVEGSDGHLDVHGDIKTGITFPYRVIGPRTVRFQSQMGDDTVESCIRHFGLRHQSTHEGRFGDKCTCWSRECNVTPSGTIRCVTRNELQL